MKDNFLLNIRQKLKITQNINIANNKRSMKTSSKKKEHMIMVTTNIICFKLTDESDRLNHSLTNMNPAIIMRAKII